MLDPVAFGKDMGALIRSAVKPLEEKIASLEKQLADAQKAPGPAGKDGAPGEAGKDGVDGVGIASASINADGELELELSDGTRENLGRVVGKDGADGRDGADGVNGKDAEPAEIDHDDVVKALKADPEFMREIVTDYLKDNPPPAGKDGRDGVDGRDGKDGEKGADGKDGTGATGAMIDKGGELIITLSDGTLQRCGVVVGKDGENGRDGADLSDVEFEYDGERGITVKAKGGQVVKTYQMPVIIDKGYWRDGCAAEAGDTYTHDGSLWIARKATTARPSTQAKDEWRLAARKGRDGKPGRDGVVKESRPIDLRGNDGD